MDDLSFPRVEAILMIGEPKLWESNLQLLIDLLLTEGKPTRAPSSILAVRQLPIIACNMDLVFMDRACMPRFGHGSFLLCLESLYKVKQMTKLKFPIKEIRANFPLLGRI